MLFKHKWNRVAIRFATICFLLGTLLMLIALMAENDLILTIGIAFLVLYIPITIIILFVLFVNAITHLRDIHEQVITCIIVLLNFPIALLYINFLNATSSL